MKYSINGVVLNKNILTEESLNTMCKEIDSSYNSCSKAIEAYNLVSNVKAMESFGYKATEGLGESIKNGAKAVWEKIKEFFRKIVQFFKRLFQSKKIENTVKKAEEVKKEINQLETTPIPSNNNSNNTLKISGLLYSLLTDTSLNSRRYAMLEFLVDTANVAYNDLNEFVGTGEEKLINLVNLIKSGQYINEDKDIGADLFTKTQIQKLRSDFLKVNDLSNEALLTFDQAVDNTPVNLSLSEFVKLIKSKSEFFGVYYFTCKDLSEIFIKYSKLAYKSSWIVDNVLSKSTIIQNQKINTYYAEIGKSLSISLSTTMKLTKKLSSMFDTLLSELKDIHRIRHDFLGVTSNK